jgi:ATP-dependent RNA helicase RhlE
LDNFHGFGLAAPLNAALAKLGFAHPTPIQAQAIPPLMKGRDLVGIAQTGTGKTAAFALPILHKLATDRRHAPRGGARVLVLSPTRELASQIAQSFRDLSDGLSLKIAVVFGGVPHGAQIRALQAGLDVLVATPGRLLDHLDAGVARLGAVEFLVLDEVDQMLDLGCSAIPISPASSSSPAPSAAPTASPGRSTKRGSMLPPSTATRARASASGRLPPSATARRERWSPPTLPRAASTSMA